MARPVGRWFRVAEIVNLFEQMGCEVQKLPGQLVGEDGVSFTVRYVLNHETGRFVAITDLDDDDHVPLTEVQNWMRQLDVVIPLPPEGA